MPNYNHNMANQHIDIAGSDNLNQDKILIEEFQGLGEIIISDSGATISSSVGDSVTITNLSGITNVVIGKFITIENAAASSNNGTFAITDFISSSSIKYTNASAIIPEPNPITWSIRNSYCLEDDLNFERTDRAKIKGVNFYDPIPVYQQSDATTTNLDTNLVNIAGKTTDARGFIANKFFYNISPSVGSDRVTISSAGNLKHSNSINKIGVPVFDGAPYLGNYPACFVGILDGYTDTEITVQSGFHMGEKIFGITNAGSSISPNSVEIIFYSVPHGMDPSINSSLYIWEASQIMRVTLIYGYFERLDQLSDESLRNIIIQGATSGSSGSGITAAEHETLKQLIHYIDEGGGVSGPTAFGAYKEITPSGSIFPDYVCWYTNSSKAIKVVDMQIVSFTGTHQPSVILWTIYQNDGITAARTVQDTITYDISDIFELNRTRIIT